MNEVTLPSFALFLFLSGIEARLTSGRHPTAVVNMKLRASFHCQSTFLHYMFVCTLYSILYSTVLPFAKPALKNRDGNIKLLRSPGIDSKESIQPSWWEEPVFVNV
jgi:hypothetical protein